MIVAINALDNLFFKDGKPFDRAGGAWADGQFPPSPSVLYGALRSLYFSQNMAELSKATTDEDPTRNLRIKGIYFQYKGEVYYPVPKDIVELKSKEKGQNTTEKKEKKYHTRHLKFVANATVFSNCPTPFFAAYPETVEPIKDGLISGKALLDYLDGETENGYITKLSDYLVEEPKIGISRNDFTHTATEGQIYRVGMLRVKDEYVEQKETPYQLKILVDFDGLDLKLTNSRLGAEGKTVHLSKSEVEPDFSIDNFSEHHFRLVLHTPAIFDDGWKPNCKAVFEERGIEVELLSAIVGKPIRIGGFDIVKRRPKAMRSAVPAGAVYYFKVTNMTFEKAHEKLGDLVSVSDKRAKEGFGLFSLASVDFEALIIEKKSLKNTTNK